MLVSLVYASSATRLLSDDELVSLLFYARAKNQSLDISGMLLYKDGNFLQVLEGEEASLLRLYETIERDPRHRGLIRLLKTPITERRFGEWSMGFKSVGDADLEDLPGYSEFLNGAVGCEAFQADPGRAEKLLLHFRDRM